MRKSTCLRSATQVLGLLPSCATLAYPLFTTADRSVLPTGTVPQARVTPEQVAETAGIKVTAAPAAFPLSAPGSYGVGVREFSAQDACRDDREVDASVWHPALLPEGATGKRTMAKGEPDRSDPPYPLIVSSAKMGSDLAPYAVTHGFFWAGLTRIDTYAQMNTEMIDQPFDILFALDKVASDAPEDLAGMIDAEGAGADGCAFEGYSAPALRGARINSEQYFCQYPDPDPTTRATPSSMSAFGCGPARDWESLSAHAGPTITLVEEERL